MSLRDWRRSNAPVPRVTRTDEPIPLDVVKPASAEDCPFCGDDAPLGTCSRRCPASRRDAERARRVPRFDDEVTK